MTRVNVYLNFAGTTEEAFQFYQSVFGGEFTGLMRMKDAPGTEYLSPEDAGRIMHIAFKSVDNLVLHATDALESMGHPLTVGNNFNLMVEVSSKAEADKFFNALSAGGQIGMPMEDTFWGDYYGSLTDRFGIQWMIDYEPPRQ